MASSPSARMSPVLEAYLNEVAEHAYVLPRESRHDLRSAIWSYCARHAGPEADDERMRAVLAELGEPDELVAAELDRSGVAPNPFRPRDIVPIHLLGASVVLFGLGAPLGLALLWRSPVWPRSHKIVATVLVLAGTPVLTGVDALRPGRALWLGATVVGAAVAALYLLVLRLLARGRRTERGDHAQRGTPEIPPSEDADPPPAEGGTTPRVEKNL